MCIRAYLQQRCSVRRNRTATPTQTPEDEEEKEEFIHKRTCQEVSPTSCRVAISRIALRGRARLYPYPPGLNLVLSVRLTLLAPEGASREDGGDCYSDGANKLQQNTGLRRAETHVIGWCYSLVGGAAPIPYRACGCRRWLISIVDCALLTQFPSSPKRLLMV